MASARNEGIKPGLALLLGSLAQLEFLTGEWGRAEELLDELGGYVDDIPVVAVANGTHGLLQVCRGQIDEGRSVIDTAIATAFADQTADLRARTCLCTRRRLRSG